MRQQLHRTLPLVWGAIEGLKTAIAAQHGLTNAQMSLIFWLRDGPLSPGDLARRSNVTTSAVSHMLNDLDARGSIERLTDSTDRRRVLVSVDRALIESLVLSHRRLDAALDQVANEMGSSDTAVVVRFLTLLHTHLDAVLAEEGGVRTGRPD